jgi:hypothetical protein
MLYGYRDHVIYNYHWLYSYANQWLNRYRQLESRGGKRKVDLLENALTHQLWPHQKF